MLVLSEKFQDVVSEAINEGSGHDPSVAIASLIVDLISEAGEVKEDGGDPYPFSHGDVPGIDEIINAIDVQARAKGLRRLDNRSANLESVIGP